MATEFLVGDVREMLRTLPDESVHCVVTSPPYWGLRDYGTARWVGGDPACDHIAGMARNDTARETPGGRGGSFRGGSTQFRDECGKCGAHRKDIQLGLERTPEEYVAAMVEVFREVRRVLRKDGTCWLNLGDSYAGNRSYQVPDSKHRDVGNSRGMTVSRRRDDAPIPRSDLMVEGLKPKDLVGIPWRVAFALQADGWWLRSDIIWAKPNPMPESVTDRPTRSHEYLFLLTKSERYFYDAEAIKEPMVSSPEEYARAGASVRQNHAYGEVGGTPLGKKSFATVPNGRNKRDVWTIATEPFPGAHFAVMPGTLAALCIRAGCPVGGTVLDPFGGSGTVALMAERTQRASIYVDANRKYAAMAKRRLGEDPEDVDEQEPDPDALFA